MRGSEAEAVWPHLFIGDPPRRAQQIERRPSRIDHGLLARAIAADKTESAGHSRPALTSPAALMAEPSLPTEYATHTSAGLSVTRHFGLELSP
jgi:hypothetical protein